MQFIVMINKATLAEHTTSMIMATMIVLLVWFVGENNNNASCILTLCLTLLHLILHFYEAGFTYVRVRILMNR